MALMLFFMTEARQPGQEESAAIFMRRINVTGPDG